MAQSGFTPILIYASGTATNVPLAANLTSSASGAELALNYTDGKLYYKDDLGVVQLLASKAGASGSVTSVDVSGGTTGLTTSGGPVTSSGTITLAGTLVAANGGTGFASYTAGDMLYASGATAISKLTIGTTDYVMTSSGTAPQWSQYIGVPQGGTGLTSGTSGGIPYYSASNTMASSAALSANSLVIGGGAGAAPSTITTGTGVVTALGVNTGTAGAFVVNGGALGTPSSGTLTNATGLPISTGVSGLGTSVATALAVNVGTAGAVVVNGGALGTPSSGTLTNATGLPISTGVSGLGSGVATALALATNATGGFPTTNGTATLTNKRIDPRVSSTASASSVTPDISAYDMYAFTALAANLTINAPTGTPADGDKLMFRILDNGVARSLSWNGTFTVIGVTLPTSTTTGKMTYVGCIYNLANTRWDVVAVTTQA